MKSLLESEQTLQKAFDSLKVHIKPVQKMISQPESVDNLIEIGSSNALAGPSTRLKKLFLLRLIMLRLGSEDQRQFRRC